ncbi:hypothetical protein ACIA5G_35215 [Amycolatopsis sp. NPDC051758]|uniref:hypothetical protein n=1 Tax=Amycolatopsis sp. NPDC051758 TaxID=3363935 RepID=UPI00378C6A96
MNEFKNALGAAFGVEPVEVPGLVIDQLDGRSIPASADVKASICRAERPVLPSVSPCVLEPPPVVMSICRAESFEPVGPGAVTTIAE